MRLFRVSVMILFVGLMFFTSSALLAEDEKLLKPNDAAPEFSARDFSGKTVELNKLLKKGPLVLVFLRGFG